MSSLDQGPAVPLERWGSEKARVAVLAVHGRDQNPDVMKGYSTRFALDATADIAFYAPHADGDSWYPEPFLVPLDRNADSVDRALRIIDRCLDQLRTDGFESGSIVLWGFSQGACVLSHHLLIRQPRVAAAILFTGGYIGAEPLEPTPGPGLAGLPIIVRSIDPFVPPWRVRDTVSLLESAGAKVDLRIDPGEQHIVTDEAYTSASRAIAFRRSNWKKTSMAKPPLKR